MAPENFVIARLEAESGRVSVAQAMAVFELFDQDLIFSLLEYFELCFPLDEKQTVYVFPAVLREQMPEGAWVDGGRPYEVYIGRRFQCVDETDILSPG